MTDSLTNESKSLNKGYYLFVYRVYNICYMNTIESQRYMFVFRRLELIRVKRRITNHVQSSPSKSQRFLLTDRKHGPNLLE